MSDEQQRHGGRKRNWQTDEAIESLPAPETYPNRRGSIPRDLLMKRVQETYDQLVGDVPLGKLKRELSRKWSAERPDYPVKPRSVEAYIEKANEHLRCDFKAVGGENYWPRSVAYWQARVSNEELSDEARERAKKQLDKIMESLRVKKIALTDVAGNDLPGIGQLRERLMATDEGREALCRLTAAANRAANSSIQPSNGHERN